MSHRRSFRFQPQMGTLECRTVPSMVPNNALVIGASAGSDPFVMVIDPNTNRESFRFMPFEQSFRGGVSVAVGDLVGDDTPDIAVAAASNGGPRVAIYDGSDGKVVQDFFVYEPSFNGGVSLAIGDINDDGANDLITGAGRSGGPRVVVIDVATGNTIRDFFAFEDSFRGGVNVGSGDVNGDGSDDILVGTGVGGAPRVTAFSGDDTGNPLLNFFAFDSKFRDGVNVSTVDLNGDGTDDIITGAGTGGAPHVRVISGVDGAELENFFAFDPNGRGGARVAAVDTNGDGDGDTLVVGTPGHLRRFFRDADGVVNSDDIEMVDISRGAFLAGRGDDSRGRGGDSSGRGGDHDDRGDVTSAQSVAGVIAAINPDEGTVTIRTGPNDTLAIFPIGDDARLERDGETVDDLTAFQEDDVALIRIGSDREISSLVAASADAEAIESPVGRTIQGAVVAVDETAGTVSVLTRSGTVFLVETDDGTLFNRRGDSDAILTDFVPGDLVEARIGSDGFANRIGTVNVRLGSIGGDDRDGNGSHGRGSNGSGGRGSNGS
ncbi:MAG TPA: hypothetical protein VM597_11330 [Gemmataceae bacterium]|nr:hypothetical protein [Gemmataceae bacterium]